MMCFLFFPLLAITCFACFHKWLWMNAFAALMENQRVFLWFGFSEHSTRQRRFNCVSNFMFCRRCVWVNDIDYKAKVNISNSPSITKLMTFHFAVDEMRNIWASRFTIESSQPATQSWIEGSEAGNNPERKCFTRGKKRRKNYRVKDNNCVFKAHSGEKAALMLYDVETSSQFSIV